VRCGSSQNGTNKPSLHYNWPIIWQATGYYILFHARPNVYGKLPDEALEYVTQIAGKTIYVFLVRLGHLFEEPQRTTSG